MYKQGILFILFILLSFVMISYTHARSYGKSLCQYAGFDCLKVKRGQSWYSLFPDEHDRDIVMRINRMNTELYSGMVIAVPEEVSQSDIMDFSPFPRQISPPGEKIIIIDPLDLAFGAYDGEGLLIK